MTQRSIRRRTASCPRSISQIPARTGLADHAASRSTAEYAVEFAAVFAGVSGAARNGAASAASAIVRHAASPDVLGGRRDGDCLPRAHGRYAANRFAAQFAGKAGCAESRTIALAHLAAAAQCGGWPATIANAPPGAGHDFGALAGVWNSLAGTVPFRSFEWMESWWRHYRMPGWQTYLLKVEDAAGQIVGIAPWYLSRSPVAGRVVQFLGSGEACSEYQTLLARPGTKRQSPRRLSQWLVDRRGWRLGFAAAEPAAADDPARRRVGRRIRRRRPSGRINGRECRAGNASCRRRGTNSCGSCRNRGENGVRQLTRKYFDAGRVQTRWVIERPPSWTRASRCSSTCINAAAKAWASRAAMRRSDSPQFHQEVSRRLFAEGKLRLLWTELDGRPVGAEYDFIDGRTVYYYSTGVEPDATADQSRLAGDDRFVAAGDRRRLPLVRLFARRRGLQMLVGREAVSRRLKRAIVARRRLAGLRHAAWLGPAAIPPMGEGSEGMGNATRGNRPTQPRNGYTLIDRSHRLRPDPSPRRRAPCRP